MHDIDSIVKDIFHNLNYALKMFFMFYFVTMMKHIRKSWSTK